MISIEFRVRLVIPNTQISYTWRFVNPNICSVIPKVRYSEGSFIRKWNKVRYSEGSLIRKWNNVRYSEGSLFRRSVIPKIR